MVSTYKGWAVMEPLNEQADVLTNFVFPLDLEGRYAIGSRNTENFKVSFLVPEVEIEGNDLFPIEAVLNVNADGEIILKRPVGENDRIAVDGQVVEGGTSRRVPVGTNASICLGPWLFLLKRSKGVLDEESLSKASEIRHCHVCKNNDELEIRVMPCGHNICAKCRREGTIQPNNGLRTRHPRAGANREPLIVARQGQVHVVHTPPLQCRLCRTRVTLGVAMSSQTSITANQMGNIMSEVKFFDVRRPMCDGCQNQRGLMTSRDYEFCEECQQILCPVCVLQGHRRHNLRPKVARLRALDVVEKEIERMNKTMADAERRLKEAHADKRVEEIKKGSRQMGNAVTQCLHSLNQKIMQCRQQLNFIMHRKRALARGWDETSKYLAAGFDRFVQQTRDLHVHLERLCNFEVSLSVSSSSEEDSTMLTASDSTSETVTELSDDE